MLPTYQEYFASLVKGELTKLYIRASSDEDISDNALRKRNALIKVIVTYTYQVTKKKILNPTIRMKKMHP